MATQFISRPQDDPSLVRLARFDESTPGGQLLPNGDWLFTFAIPDGVGQIFFEGVGGGGGGGGGASGRGHEWPCGGGGAGGNGCYAPNVYATEFRPGDIIQLRLGHGGAAGAHAVGTDQFGSNGAPGGDSSVLLGQAVLFTFPGAPGGSGGQFSTSHDRGHWFGGTPGISPIPPRELVGYGYTVGGCGGKDGRASQPGAAVTVPPGGIGGSAGGGNGNGGGGGGAASIKGNGGAGGTYAQSNGGIYGGGLAGHFGAGGGGGAGGGPGTSDDGGPAGSGGMGYIWLYTLTQGGA